MNVNGNIVFKKKKYLKKKTITLVFPTVHFVIIHLGISVFRIILYLAGIYDCYPGYFVFIFFSYKIQI